jgi:cellulose biosynthesis protein BcsQ
MRISITNLKACGKSTCAVNLARKLADLGITATDRWQGNRRVVLVDADRKGAAMRYWSGGRLPVSAEHIPLWLRTCATEPSIAFVSLHGAKGT